MIGGIKHMSGSSTGCIEQSPHSLTAWHFAMDCWTAAWTDGLLHGLLEKVKHIMTRQRVTSYHALCVARSHDLIT